MEGGDTCEGPICFTIRRVNSSTLLGEGESLYNVVLCCHSSHRYLHILIGNVSGPACIHRIHFMGHPTNCAHVHSLSQPDTAIPLPSIFGRVTIFSFPFAANWFLADIEGFNFEYTCT